MKNNQESDLNFQMQMLDAHLKINLVNNCITDIVQKLDADEVFESIEKKELFEINLANTYISSISDVITKEVVDRGIENENYSLIVTMLDFKSIIDFFERIGTIAALVPDITSQIFAQITELYTSQCNKYLIDLDEELLMHSPIFAN